MYGMGNNDINIRDVSCTGSESNIAQCSYYNVTFFPGHQEDVGAQCQQGIYKYINHINEMKGDIGMADQQK